ncbi:hypothetical protein DSO57_1021196 [Entomophthora muscae]|uniref:Uncharacterized protein n=1 Tax=Entomophthora muscae TaxID=34485 RepID=A0ACC2U269_9FUNG|nr:hypothetical protein DSO57_1021196 [Entomophthora muscae]
MSYEPLTTTVESSAPVIYSTIDNATANKRYPTFYTKVPIPCVKPASQDAVVPSKGQCQLRDSEREALSNCLNRGMTVWDITSQFGVIARYIGNINKKYGKTRHIAKFAKAKGQPNCHGPYCKFTATSGFGLLNLSLSYQERSQNARQTPPFVE